MNIFLNCAIFFTSYDTKLLTKIGMIGFLDDGVCFSLNTNVSDFISSTCIYYFNSVFKGLHSQCIDFYLYPV